LTPFEQVAHDRRLRSLPEQSIPSTKTDFASSRSSSGIARPSFAKMYEFIDSSLENKLAQMVDDAVTSRMEASGKVFFSGNEQQQPQNYPIEEHTSSNRSTLPRSVASMSPAPQPSPRMHSRPLDYSSPTPQLSDISSFGSSPDKHFPSAFANVALGWQDSMGLPINMVSEDSPITRALKKITDHLGSSSASEQLSFLQSALSETSERSLLMQEQQQQEQQEQQQQQQQEQQQQQQQQSSDEYSHMIATTFAALSQSISPNHHNRAISPLTAQTQNTSFLKSSPRKLSYHKLFVENLSAENDPEYHITADTSLHYVVTRPVLGPIDSVPSQEISSRSDIPASAPSDSSLICSEDNKSIRRSSVRFNLFETEQQTDEDATSTKGELSQYDNRHHLQKTSTHIYVRDARIEEYNFQQEDAAKNPKSAEYIRIPECIDLEDEFIKTTLSPSTATTGERHRHTRERFEHHDPTSIMNDKLSFMKQEAIVLEEGIDSIRGITELLEMYTSIPSNHKKYSPKYDATGQAKEFAESNANVGKPRELEYEMFSPETAPNDAQQGDEDHAFKYWDQSHANLSMLSTTADSPQRPCPKVNVVANILRDALPVQGLDLSQNDSDIAEGAISGDNSDDYNNSDDESAFHA
jgi:type II secretory pathway pseudopilin PulG